MTLYLIAHKVRGEPAFDIAAKIYITEDDWIWVIPTSGHRAYPYFHLRLDEARWDIFTINDISPMPADLPDHYPAVREPSRSERPSAPAKRGITPPTPEDL